MKLVSPYHGNDHATDYGRSKIYRSTSIYCLSLLSIYRSISIYRLNLPSHTSIYRNNISIYRPILRSTLATSQSTVPYVDLPYQQFSLPSILRSTRAFGATFQTTVSFDVPYQQFNLPSHISIYRRNISIQRLVLRSTLAAFQSTVP